MYVRSKEVSKYTTIVELKVPGLYKTEVVIKLTSMYFGWWSPRGRSWVLAAEAMTPEGDGSLVVVDDVEAALPPRRRASSRLHEKQG